MFIHHDRDTLRWRMKEIEDECREARFARCIRHSQRDQPQQKRK
ncbi:hypothetical protein [Alteribacter lacisalsi]|nr:hypothetical protein [Alteribacter lacisalsi]